MMIWSKMLQAILSSNCGKKKEYNAKTDGRNFFNQPIKDGLKTYENIRKIATDQSDDYTSIFQKLL